MGGCASSPEEPPPKAAAAAAAATAAAPPPAAAAAKYAASPESPTAKNGASKSPAVQPVVPVAEKGGVGLSIPAVAAPPAAAAPPPEPAAAPVAAAPAAAAPASQANANADACKSAASAQDTVMKISALMQKFAEVRNERTAPVQVLRKVLDLVIADCRAKFASIQIISEDKDAALIVALVGAPETYLERNRFQRLTPGSGYAAELIINGAAQLEWKHDAPPAVIPAEWSLIIARAGVTRLAAVPISVSGVMLAVLTLAVDESKDTSSALMWSSYMQLLSASLSNLMKDKSIPKYIQLVKDVYDTNELDALVHKLVGHFRVILGHINNSHVWYRLALTSTSNAAATIFDDLTQVPAPAGSSYQRSTSSSSASSSSQLIKDVQAAGGVIRSVVNMKNTIMKISIQNRQQVMIPDVQKLINQSGNVSVDIFNTRLIKPPTSVLVFPLKLKHHIFGVVFCMSGIQSDFSDLAPRLRELCEIMSPHLLQALSNGALQKEYTTIQDATPDTQGSQSGSISLSKGGSDAYAIGSSLGGSMSGDHSAFTHSRSSTGALVTGLTEKLNQKRIKTAMEFSSKQMKDLQITNLLGEGGFAKVFRGLWQGLVVGIKIVVDDGKNEKMVMKNAHEIAILSTLSHPHVTQAYLCLTDVAVHELMTTCMRAPHPAVLSSPAYKYLQANEDKLCHVEVIEYCDLGNLSTGLKNLVFYSGPVELVLAQLSAAAACGQSDNSASEEYHMREKPRHARINMRSLLLTLIEIANSIAYLHRMGVVHCDIKPANVLLKSSNNDPRGYSAKVSDFGLSRVEDDDSSSSFPFNSCGTAAYVAPEALICNKKVNSSVDVYAFGILMWEMYTTRRPYGTMNQQQLVEEVVMRSLRPKFPGTTPGGYVQLAQWCWNGAPGMRPAFDEVLVILNNMLQAINDRTLDPDAPVEPSNGQDDVEYLTDAKDSKRSGAKR